jgi:hypothetical protein
MNFVSFEFAAFLVAVYLLHWSLSLRRRPEMAADDRELRFLRRLELALLFSDAVCHVECRTDHCVGKRNKLKSTRPHVHS